MEITNSKSSYGWAAFAIAIVLLALLAVVTEGNIRPDSKSYQAVFLNNGQVYFGKLHRAHSQTPYLTDIYYLKTNPPLQGAEGSEQRSQLSLVKFGNEIHGPQDQMFLNREYLLFWENLKPTSQVVGLIGEHKKQSQEMPTPAEGAVPTPTPTPAPQNGQNTPAQPLN